MALALAITVLASAALIGAGRVAGPRVPLGAQRHRPVADRVGLGLFFVSVFGGLAVATGAAPGGLPAVFGALIGCMVSRVLVTDRGGDRPFGRAIVWFVIVAWCAMVGPLTARSLQPQQALAAQAVQGPLALSTDPFKAIPASLALAAGLVAAAWWCRLQRGAETDRLEAWMRAGESGLAATVVTASAWGPSLLVLIRGPLGRETLLWSGVSLLVSIAAVATVAWARDRVRGPESLWMWPCLAVTLLAVASGLVGAWA